MTSCSTRDALSALGWSQEEPRVWQGYLSLCFWSQNFKCAFHTYRFLHMNSYFKVCPAAGRMCLAQWATWLHAGQCQFFCFSRVMIFFGGKRYWLFLIWIYMHTQSLVWINFLSHLNTWFISIFAVTVGMHTWIRVTGECICKDHPQF